MDSLIFSDQEKRRVSRLKAGPRNVQEIIVEVMSDEGLAEGVNTIMDHGRISEYRSILNAALVGVATHAPARAHFEARLDNLFSRGPGGRNRLPKSAPEVVVGAGLHAAIWCAARVAAGKPKPLVIEATDNVGGSFAVSRAPAFYLNSVNRPGELGTPGRGQALNVIPGAPVQPADLSGDRYQRNNDLAFCIRTTLAMFAEVITECRVQMPRGPRLAGRPFTIYDENAARSISTKKATLALGLGTETRVTQTAIPRLLTFGQFMARMDTPFPMRDMRRVAVIGNGDGAKTVIEALVGQGPNMGMSTAELDYIEEIDWYGPAANYATCENYEGRTRGRYKQIGRELPRQDGSGVSRIKVLGENAGQVAPSYNGVMVNGRRYDHAISAVGYVGFPGFGELANRAEGGRELGRQGDRYGGVLVVGPAAQLGLDSYEQADYGNVPENAVAAFRWADRTATLADLV